MKTHHKIDIYYLF